MVNSQQPTAFSANPRIPVQTNPKLAVRRLLITKSCQNCVPREVSGGEVNGSAASALSNVLEEHAIVSQDEAVAGRGEVDVVEVRGDVVEASVPLPRLATVLGLEEAPAAAARIPLILRPESTVNQEMQGRRREVNRIGSSKMVKK